MPSRLAIALQLLGVGTRTLSFAPPLRATQHNHGWAAKRGRMRRLFAAAPVYCGPEGDPIDMVASLEVEELGLVLEVGGSAVAPGSLGLFARLAPGVDRVELPALALLGGYARGTFSSDASGDKTVGFALATADVAVFFERQLMPVRDALAAVADRAAARHVPVALACHDVGVEDVGVEDVGVGLGVGAEEGVQAGGDGSNRSELSGNQERESDRAGSRGSSTSSDSSSLGRLVVRPSTFVARLSEEDRAVPRYFVPDLPAEVDLCGGSRADGVAVPVVGATNLGMWCNDRAFEASAELGDEAAYRARAAELNCVQLVWRLAWDDAAAMLVPTWPVSVLSRDVCFENRAPEELGTTYGWRYWQAAVFDPAAPAGSP